MTCCSCLSFCWACLVCRGFFGVFLNLRIWARIICPALVHYLVVEGAHAGRGVGGVAFRFPFWGGAPPPRGQSPKQRRLSPVCLWLIDPKP